MTPSLHGALDISTRRSNYRSLWHVCDFRSEEDNRQYFYILDILEVHNISDIEFKLVILPIHIMFVDECTDRQIDRMGIVKERKSKTNLKANPESRCRLLEFSLETK